MKHRGPTFAILALIASGTACATQGFVDAGFVAHDGYSIGYTEPATCAVMPSAWKLENYFFNKQGKPSSERDDGIYVDKMEWVEDSGESFNFEYLTYDLK